MCHQPKKSLYEIRLHGQILLVCSSICAESARQNWQEKIDKGITPQQPYEKPQEKEESDNIDSF